MDRTKVEEFIAYKAMNGDFKSDYLLSDGTVRTVRAITFGEWFEKFIQQVRTDMPIVSRKDCKQSNDKTHHSKLVSHEDRADKKPTKKRKKN